MTDKYILDGKNPVPCYDLLAWAKDFEKSDRQVALTIGSIMPRGRCRLWRRPEKIRISTVFLGLDHALGRGEPLLFETMVFGGPLDQRQERCSTWEEAEKQHARMLGRVEGFCER